MTATWEYKVVTLKHCGGGLKFVLTPTDDEAIGELNREGALGWELVSAICVGPGQPTVLYFKRPR
ncbi:hypothetical protein GCM10008098_05060 [Rhodanobacter panaciterrae]|uniref:DUF4177 domain-containing protein n=1 Tax=Rhodanobacter panaciterrae TaxID=490572 RepID=A0ABQ2ZKS1_9GAMM|nr:DUF4177 domain-containing protein [Rhodanobacter panaciterrae]GGY16697.1 hypothetical protein GCM10008098_05060 [Rhodanobacter panaciterrae]